MARARPTVVTPKPGSSTGPTSRCTSLTRTATTCPTTRSSTCSRASMVGWKALRSPPTPTSRGRTWSTKTPITSWGLPLSPTTRTERARMLTNPRRLDDPYATIVGPGGTPAFFFNQWLTSEVAHRRRPARYRVLALRPRQPTYFDDYSQGSWDMAETLSEIWTGDSDYWSDVRPLRRLRRRARRRSS